VAASKRKKAVKVTPPQLTPAQILSGYTASVIFSFSAKFRSGPLRGEVALAIESLFAGVGRSNRWR
jgi:hypothetical protein